MQGTLPPRQSHRRQNTPAWAPNLSTAPGGPGSHGDDRLTARHPARAEAPVIAQRAEFLNQPGTFTFAYGGE